ncbi:MAG TPA: hypothetical protein VK348_02040, partial [Planctomycetota bacterium]|nr:hypothetical protein [Planctomycetota bacterium]
MPHRSQGLLATAAAAVLVVAVAAQEQQVVDFTARLTQALNHHPFFTKVAFSVDTAHPPFVFFVQRPGKDDPDYVRAIVNSYLPFLGRLQQ